MNIELHDIKNTSPKEIQQLANNAAIANNLRDIFPYPYTIADADTFVKLATDGSLGKVFSIYASDVFVGVCSLIPQTDVYRMNAEIGYWIGEPYWSKGYATEATKLLVKYAFNELKLLRVYANIFDYNLASMRVLEKAGFTREAVIQGSVFKNGKLLNEHLYSIRKI